MGGSGALHALRFLAGEGATELVIEAIAAVIPGKLGR
jgi:hypothetical protein